MPKLTKERARSVRNGWVDVMTQTEAAYFLKMSVRALQRLEKMKWGKIRTELFPGLRGVRYRLVDLRQYQFNKRHYVEKLARYRRTDTATLWDIHGGDTLAIDELYDRMARKSMTVEELKKAEINNKVSCIRRLKPKCIGNLWRAVTPLGTILIMQGNELKQVIVPDMKRRTSGIENRSRNYALPGVPNHTPPAT